MTRLDPGAPLPSVLVVTTCWWPSLARFAHLLQEGGCRVSVLCPPGHPVRAAPVSAVFDQSGLRPLRALSRAIERARPVYIVPGDDRAVGHLHRLYRTGSPVERALIARSLGAPENYPVSTSRALFLRAAAEVGLPTAAGTRLDTVADLHDWMARADPPWVLKADGTWGGSGVAITECPRAALSAFRELRREPRLSVALKRVIINRDLFPLGDLLGKPRPAVSAQRYISGQPGNLALMCRDGEVLASLVVEAVTCCGATGPAIIARVVDRPDLVSGAARLARHLGLSGFIGLDFMVDEFGAAWIVEMNPRYTPLCNIRLADGRDVLGAFLRALTGRVARAPNPASAGLIAHFPLAWHWSRADERLALCYQDIPWDQPALTEAMLQPTWPERQPLAKALAAIQRSLGLAASSPPKPAHTAPWLAGGSPDRAR